MTFHVPNGRTTAATPSCASRGTDALFDILKHTQNEYLDGNYPRLPEKGIRVAMVLASLENRKSQKISSDGKRAG